MKVKKGDQVRYLGAAVPYGTIGKVLSVSDRFIRVEFPKITTWVSPENLEKV